MITKTSLIAIIGMQFAVLLGTLLVPTNLAYGQDADAKPAAEMDPLAVKEEMIRDRFERLQDRVFRLREQLAEIEPANAKRLARVLDRTGELQLGDRLEQLVELLDQIESRGGALKEQSEWLADAERVLGILLERDSDNEQRRDEMDKLDEFKKDVDQILQQQQGLRSESAGAATARQMAQQLQQAIRRIESLLSDQEDLKDRAGEQQDHSGQQRDLARDTDELAEDLEALAQTQPPDSVDTPALREARDEADKAAESAKSSGKAMSRATETLGQQGADASSDQREAIERLEEAKKQLEEALERVKEQSELQKQSEQQEKLSDETKGLGERMRKEGSPHGQSPGQSPPGQDGLDQAQQEMDQAREALEEDQPEDAVEKQDRAIDQLEQAQKELEKALNQLRKEQRAEMLRDLEARFREMLSRQRVINEATVELAQRGKDKFTRAQELQLAEQSTKQGELADKASACLHILDEEGTTIVFPRVVAQVADDMEMVANRLASLLVGTLTQQVQKDIVDALEQLLGAVQQMQQENEQQDGSEQEEGDSENQSLLPTSAELKLLRSSQHRVNARTTAIESAKTDPAESPEGLQSASEDLAERQKELSAVATEMRDRQNQP